MQPDRDVIQIGRGKSFRTWEHGYPLRTARWHFHLPFDNDTIGQAIARRLIVHWCAEGATPARRRHPGPRLARHRADTPRKERSR